VLKVYTAQYSYNGPDRLDITVKGKHALGQVFAPTWDMVNAYKDGRMNEEQYEADFHNLMIHRWQTNQAEWQQLLNTDTVTLVCFEKPGQFCHRVLVAEYLENCGAKYLGERPLTGVHVPVTKGDLLKVAEGVICHQVNCKGKMGSGLALAIKNMYPSVYQAYMGRFEGGFLWVGNTFFDQVGPKLWVCSMCGQHEYGRGPRQTNYRGLRNCLRMLRKWQAIHRHMFGEALQAYFPFKMSSDRAGGDWYLVSHMIKDVIKDAIILRR